MDTRSGGGLPDCNSGPRFLKEWLRPRPTGRADRNPDGLPHVPCCYHGDEDSAALGPERVTAFLNSLGLTTHDDGHCWEKGMKEIVDVLGTAAGSNVERAAARAAFLRRRAGIWKDIQEERFPATYVSSGPKKFVGAPRKTAIRCDFLLASKIALGKKYAADAISDLAQRDLLFRVLRDREAFPSRTGSKFYCCPKCTAKLYECVSAKVFRYIDNAKWKAEIEGRRNVSHRA